MSLASLARMEATRRGVRNAVQVIGIHDGRTLIDPLWEEHFASHPRILDYYTPPNICTRWPKAAHPADAKAAGVLAGDLVVLLWDGKIQPLLAKLREFVSRGGRANRKRPHRPSRSGHPVPQYGFSLCVSH